MSYSLVICEKPDAAKRVADALSGGNAKSTLVEGTVVHRFSRNGEEYVVCAAQGHVYGVSDPTDERTVYPVFDVEWYPSNLLDEESEGAARRISAIKKLASGASRFVSACDLDVEGETIGFNILRYACGGREETASRARFSTLTTDDLKKAFDALEAHPERGVARSGRARHSIDFMWGVNLSRALSQSALSAGHRYRTVSVGRVQGPTLAFLVEREKAICEFVPAPYWKVNAVFEKGGEKIVAGYHREKVPTERQAKEIRSDCLGNEAVAARVVRSVVMVPPPAPFDIGGLQREAYHAFRFSPSRTLQLAERLYLAALISYPRTGSQKLPPSLNLRGIVSGLGRMKEYSGIAGEILRSDARPTQGLKSDPAHPAIHPTGEIPKRPLEPAERSLFDLVVRRFLAAFGQTARREMDEVTFVVGEHEFRASGGRTVAPGWMDSYGKYAGYRDRDVPKISEGESLPVAEVVVEEKFEQRPARFNQASLLEKMENEGIGTKATRADIISTLVGRGYVSGEGLEVSDLGFAVVEAMQRFAPPIVGVGLTRQIEDDLQSVEGGRSEASMLRDTVRAIAEQSAILGEYEDELGREIDAALTSAVSASSVLGKCPVCKTGELRMIRSKKTGKRFVGCSNYPTDCQASAPLPQKGSIRTAAKACSYCSWPVVYVSGRRRPWRLCVNPSCPGKKR